MLFLHTIATLFLALVTSGYWVVTGKEMVRIVSKLYALGISPLSAIYTATEMSDWEGYEYLLSIKIDIGKRISEAILGELPPDWQYFWNTVSPDKTELHLIAYTEKWFNLGFETVGERIGELINEFESFLDIRDIEATKALILLTSC